MTVNTSTFGFLPDGREVKLFKFETPNGLEISITNFGGIITSIKMADKNGVVEEICAGFETLDQYLKGHPHFGVIVGRFANRIANGRFTIKGKEYHLPINNGKNHLHGGDNGFHTKLWSYQLNERNDEASLVLSYLSPDLEEGYPGNVTATVTYTVRSNNVLDIDFRAQTDFSTHVNLTSHGYFNLNGFKDDIRSHFLKINSVAIVEVDESQIPTGDLIETKGTPFDFSDIREIRNSLESNPGGIDHCFALQTPRDFDTPAAELIEDQSGRSIQLFTTQPGLQVYTGNSLDGSIKGHNNTVYRKQWAVCLETQHFPDTPNHYCFPTTLLEPGQDYNHKTRLVFKNKE